MAAIFRLLSDPLRHYISSHRPLRVIRNGVGIVRVRSAVQQLQSDFNVWSKGTSRVLDQWHLSHVYCGLCMPILGIGQMTSGNVVVSIYPFMHLPIYLPTYVPKRQTRVYLTRDRFRPYPRERA